MPECDTTARFEVERAKEAVLGINLLARLMTEGDSEEKVDNAFKLSINTIGISMKWVGGYIFI